MPELQISLSVPYKTFTATEIQQTHDPHKINFLGSRLRFLPTEVFVYWEDFLTVPHLVPPLKNIALRRHT
jgi:hypothetical protein